MYSAEILMSTYNGAKVVEKQIVSIMEQKDVDIFLTIRDDGSKDDTLKVIENIARRYKNIRIIKGDNVGWKKSFLELIQLSEEHDYYGFSDQDDIWMPNKVINSIREMEADKYNGVKLTHVNSICTNEDLKPQKEQQVRFSAPRNRKSAIAQEYFQGCSMLWNNIAMQILKKYSPKADLAHDFWVGTVCFYFGKVFYIDTPQFYHIRYENNSSSDGNVDAGRKKRMQMFKNGDTVYMNPAVDLIEGYHDELDNSDFNFLRMVQESKHSFLKRLKLVLDQEFVRESKKSTLLFKLVLLLGRF